MDVLWFRLSRRLDEPEAIAGRLGPGHLAILLDRTEYWQVAYVIPKGGADEVARPVSSCCAAQSPRSFPRSPTA